MLTIQARAPEPAAALKQFMVNFEGRILVAGESTGRREVILDTLSGLGLRPEVFDSWEAFLASDAVFGITVAPLEQGLVVRDPALAVIAESQLFGERASQSRRRRTAPRTESENVVRNLTDLSIGAPVVHEEHGVGRYLGLQKLNVGTLEAEFLTLEYAAGDKLYVPVSSLHLVSRYSGASPDTAPLAQARR